MSDYPKELHKKFAKLTPAQHRLMAFASASTAKVRRSTGESLLKLGLVRKIQRYERVKFITDYEVSVPIHMAYCQWCSEVEKQC